MKKKEVDFEKEYREFLKYFTINGKPLSVEEHDKYVETMKAFKEASYSGKTLILHKPRTRERLVSHNRLEEFKEWLKSKDKDVLISAKGTTWCYLKFFS